MEVDVWEVMERMQGEIAGEIRLMLGEGIYSDSHFNDEQRRRRVEAMQKCAFESTSDEKRHEAWMKMHIDDGWIYGPNFEPAAKMHPNLKPWNELSPTTRNKARIFAIVSRAAAELERRFRVCLQQPVPEPERPVEASVEGIAKEETPKETSPMAAE